MTLHLQLQVLLRAVRFIKLFITIDYDTVEYVIVTIVSTQYKNDRKRR